MNPRHSLFNGNGDGVDKPVVVIGAASLDTIGRLKGELSTGTSNPSQIHNSFGGVARNVAENLAHLGQPVTLLSVVGSGTIGKHLLQHLSSCGVETSFMHCTENHPTSSYLAILNSAGEFQYALDDMRAVSELSSAYIRQHAARIKEASMVFIDGNLPKETMRTVVSVARRARVPVCADPTSASLAERMVKYLPDFYLITPNSAEAAVLADCPVSLSNRKETLTAAKRLVSQGVKIAVITRAEFGITYATSQTSGHIPAIRTRIVDPTGASDALTATMIFSLLNEIPLDDAVRLSVAAASLTLQNRGAVVPDLSLQRLYDQL
jgi:pseudouridine kinase